MTKFKNTLSLLYEEFYYYLLYILKHPFCSLVMATGVLLCFGEYAFATDYYVDSEVVINIAGTNYNWLEIGRYGLVFTRRLLGTSWYNPYYTGILMLLFLWLTGMTFSYVAVHMFPKLSATVTTLGSLIFITYPTFSEQYYFHFQSAEITFGLWLSMLSLGMFYLFVRDRKWIYFILTLPMYVLTFSIYQSFMPLALCGYLAVFLSVIVEKDISLSAIKHSIGGSIAHFALAFGISQGISKLCFPASNYLNNQVVWTSGISFTDALLAVMKSCLRMLIGHNIFYTSILIFAIISAAAAFLHYRSLHTYQIVLGALSALGIVITPFILTLLMAEHTAIRSQFTYSLAAVFLFYFAIQALPEEFASFKYIRFVTAAVLLAFAVSQISTVRYIWDAHQYVADYDRETSTEVLSYIYDSFIMNTGVAGTIFWGSLQPESPYDEALEGSPSYLFTSVYNLEHNTFPYCFFSTNRILGYMESMGHKFVYPSQLTHNVSSYIMNHADVPAYPAPNCFFNDLEAYTFNLGNSPDYYY